MEKRLELDWKKLPDMLLQDRVVGRAVMVTNLILLLWLAYVLADLTWRLMPGPQQEAPPPLAGNVAPAATQSTPAGRWNIAQWHLFGTKPRIQKPTPVAARPERLPETRLNLVLRGVYASEDPRAAGAILSEPSGKQGFYRVGARLPGGAVLKEVHADHIILERRGRLETLRLPKEKINGAQRNGRQASPSSAVRRTARTAVSANRVPTLREFRDLVVKDPQRLTDIVQMSPYSKGGRFIGYRIRPGKNKALFDRLGLRSGDIVTSINGIAIDSPTNGLSVLNSLATARQVGIEVERNGVRQTLQLDLDQ